MLCERDEKRKAHVGPAEGVFKRTLVAFGREVSWGVAKAEPQLLSLLADLCVRLRENNQGHAHMPDSARNLGESVEQKQGIFAKLDPEESYAATSKLDPDEPRTGAGQKVHQQFPKHEPGECQQSGASDWLQALMGTVDFTQAAQSCLRILLERDANNKERERLKGMGKHPCTPASKTEAIPGERSTRVRSHWKKSDAAPFDQLIELLHGQMSGETRMLDPEFMQKQIQGWRQQALRFEQRTLQLQAENFNLRESCRLLETRCRELEDYSQLQSPRLLDEQLADNPVEFFQDFPMI